jgi:hypothetical protein
VITRISDVFGVALAAIALWAVIMLGREHNQQAATRRKRTESPRTAK